MPITWDTYNIQYTISNILLYVIVVKDVGTTWYYGTLAFRHWTYEQCSKPLLVDFSIGFCYPICWGLSQSIIVANPMNSQFWTVLLRKSCHDYEALDAKLLLGCILSLDTFPLPTLQRLPFVTVSSCFIPKLQQVNPRGCINRSADLRWSAKLFRPGDMPPSHGVLRISPADQTQAKGIEVLRKVKKCRHQRSWTADRTNPNMSKLQRNRPQNVIARSAPKSRCFPINTPEPGQEPWPNWQQ